MKVLFVGNYFELTGWSEAARRHILALDQAGVEVVPRRLNITGIAHPNVPERVLELEKKSDRNPDIIILNTLPNLYEKGPVKTVGFYMVETSHFRGTNWTNGLNLMDAAITPCFHNKQAAIDSRVTVPIYVVPLAVDLKKFEKDYPVHPVRTHYPDKFIFYVIAEWSTRKNIDAIIKAFHLEFSPTEPVELVIKTTPVGFSNPQQEIAGRVESIKKGLKLYKNLSTYKNEHIMCNFVGEDEILSLHQSCDCYVSASQGEAFNLSLADAFIAGNIAVTPDHSGLDYVTQYNSYVVSSRVDSCFNALDTLPDLYSGRETWFVPSVLSLREGMRNAFTKKDLNRKKIERARMDIKQFSPQIVGLHYKKTLEDILK